MLRIGKWTNVNKSDSFMFMFFYPRRVGDAYDLDNGLAPNRQQGIL